MITPKITKEEFDLFCSESLPVKEHRKLGYKIDTRFAFIIESISIKFKWVDYDNEGGDEDSPGHFSIARYKENIGFTGDYSVPSPYGDDDEIPTRWLWEDYMDEFNATVAKNKEEVEKAKEKDIQDALTAKLNKISKFLASQNLTITKVDHNGIIKSAIVFNNPKLTEDYVIEFLKKNLK